MELVEVVEEAEVLSSLQQHHNKELLGWDFKGVEVGLLNHNKAGAVGMQVAGVLSVVEWLHNSNTLSRLNIKVGVVEEEHHLSNLLQQLLLMSLEAEAELVWVVAVG